MSGPIENRPQLTKLPHRAAEPQPKGLPSCQPRAINPRHGDGLLRRAEAPPYIQSESAYAAKISECSSTTHHHSATYDPGSMRSSHAAKKLGSSIRPGVTSPAPAGT